MYAALLVLAALLFLGLGHKSHAQHEREMAGINIGVIAGLTGRHPDIFHNWLSGISLASYQHKQLPQYLPYSLFIQDDGFEPFRGLEAFRILTSTQRIDALLNGSSVTLGVIDGLLKNHRIPVLQLAEQQVEPSDDTIFQIMPGNIAAERALGTELRTRYPRGLAVIHAANPVINRFKSAFASGYQSNFEAIAVGPDQTDFSEVVQRVLAIKPTSILILVPSPQGSALLERLHHTVPYKVNYAFDILFQFGVQNYRRRFPNLDFLHNSHVMAMVSETSEDFKRIYREKYQEPPGLMADIGFDSFNILTKTYNRNPRIWVRNIKELQYQGASGLVAFDSVGVRKSNFKFLTVRELLAERN